MQNSLLIWKDSRRIIVEKEKIIRTFLKELAYQDIRGFYYFYYMYIEIFENIDKIETIQIYEDDIVRLHLIPESHYFPKRSIFIEEPKASNVKFVLEKFFSND